LEFIKQSEEQLRDNGIPARKIRRIVAHLDLQRFNPSKRNGFLKKRCGVTAKTRLLTAFLTKSLSLPDKIWYYRVVLRRA